MGFCTQAGACVDPEGGHRCAAFGASSEGPPDAVLLLPWGVGSVAGDRGLPEEQPRQALVTSHVLPVDVA